MTHRAYGSMVITVRGPDRHIEVEMDGHTRMVKPAPDLWELQEVLAAYEAESIFLDLHLPITFGVELLRTLREAYPRVPITTKVETHLSGCHYFSIEAQERGIALKPLPPESGSSLSAVVDKE